MKKLVIIAVFLFMAVAVAYAAAIRGMTVFPNGVWIGERTDTASSIDGPADLYVGGDIEYGGVSYGPKSFNIPLTSFFIDGTGIIGNDGTTAPGIGETDNIPAIVYASSAEQTKIQTTFRLPIDYSSSLQFRILMSSSAATSVGQSIDWQLWINDDDTTFASSAVAQDAVSPTSSTLNASNEVITLTIDATGEAALSAGSYVTLDIWNAGTSDNTTEIKGIQAYYK